MITDSDKIITTITNITTNTTEPKSRIIKIFEDGTKLEYKTGSFNPYCIFYTSKGFVEQINGNSYLKRIQSFSRFNNKKLLIFELAINDIYNINSNTMDDITKERLEYIIKNYNNIFLPNDLYWDKIAYLMLSIFIAEDNWRNKETGKESVFKRGMYYDETLRVGILNEDVEETCKLYTGKSISEIRNLFIDTRDKIESMKGYQKTLFDF